MVYPPTPVNVPASITQPSAGFKKEVGGVLTTIILFFIVYLLMFLLAIGLVAACLYGGFAIITNLTSIYGILAGIGVAGVGVMVFIFLVKFLFAVSRFDDSQSVQITEEQQPVLFAFIRQVTIDTQTPFPKKIYLSPDVNASVFYNSSFWSMFLPVKKNLQIGLGLVNAVNVSEFKAVMAHEFGHFSQRSMKLGSFVYNVNMIIHNLLFQNNSYSNFLSGWASVSEIFAIFARITAGIAQGIQWVLRKMYGVVNKSYMRLSREMEFHADAVAASVSGSEPLITALRRLELADSGYALTLEKCTDLFRDKKVSANVYTNQLSVITRLAQEFKLKIEHGLPQISDEFLENHNRSRVNYKDQWASHPTTADREANLRQIGVEAAIITDSAWVLFTEKEYWQAELTRKIYSSVAPGEDTQLIHNDEFEKKLDNDRHRFSFPDLYKGFYDNRMIAPLTDEEVDKLFSVQHSATELLTPENTGLPQRIAAAKNDIEVLKAITQKNIQVKSFDFDGAKYPAKESATILTRLEEEVKQQEEQLKELDKQLIASFIARDNSLAEAYKYYFEKRRQADQYLEKINALLEGMAPVFSGQTIPIPQINSMIGTLKEVNEPALKKNLQEWVDRGVYDQEEAGKQKAEKFLTSSYEYFSGTSFFDNELGELHSVCHESWAATQNWLFLQFKTILEKQVVLNNSSQPFGNLL